MKKQENMKMLQEYTHTSDKKHKGITLVVLVITIVILLILAGITLATLTGDTGLFTRGKQAKQNTLEAQERENLAIESYENAINDVINGTVSSSRDDVSETNIKGQEFQFVNGNEGFIDVMGETEFSSLGVTPKSFYDTGASGWRYQTKIEKELENSIELNDKFEISSQIFLNNGITENMGGVNITLYKKVGNGEFESVNRISVNDGWGFENKLDYTAGISNISLGSYLANNNNGSGRLSVIGDGNKAYFYWGNVLKGSVDYTQGLKVDKIEIQFIKYQSNNFCPTIVESLYIGEPKYYRSYIITN